MFRFLWCLWVSRLNENLTNNSKFGSNKSNLNNKSFSKAYLIQTAATPSRLSILEPYGDIHHHLPRRVGSGPRPSVPSSSSFSFCGSGRKGKGSNPCFLGALALCQDWIRFDFLKMHTYRIFLGSVLNETTSVCLLGSDTWHVIWLWIRFVYQKPNTTSSIAPIWLQLRTSLAFKKPKNQKKEPEKISCLPKERLLQTSHFLLHSISRRERQIASSSTSRVSKSDSNSTTLPRSPWKS